MKPSRTKVLDDLSHQLLLGKRVLVIGVVLMAAAIFFFIKESKDYHSCTRAPGKIVEMDKEQHEKNTSFFPVVEFHDTTGQKHLFHTRNAQLQTWSGWNGYYNIGDALGVFYPSANPENARLDNLPTVWGKTLASSAFGLIFITIGILLWNGAKTCPVDELTSRDDPFYEEN